MLAQPTAFGIGHRLAERILPLQPRTVQCLLLFRELLRRLILSAKLRQLPGNGHEKSEAVLEIGDLGLSKEPVPIEIRIRDQHPGQRIDHARVDVTVAEDPQQKLRRIQQGPLSKIGETGIADRTEGSCGLVGFERISAGSHRKRTGGKFENARESLSQTTWYGTSISLKEAHIGLGHVQPARQLGLSPFTVTTSVAKIEATHAANYNILCYITRQYGTRPSLRLPD